MFWRRGRLFLGARRKRRLMFTPRKTWVRSLSPEKHFDSSEAIEVGIKVEVLKKMEGLILGFTLYSEYGYELAYVLYDDARNPPAQTVHPGILELKFIIPANTLASG